MLAVVQLTGDDSGDATGSPSPSASSATPSQKASRSPSRTASSAPTSSAPDQVSVVADRYLGRPADQARSDLRALGLRVRLVTVANPEGEPAGTVSAVSPTGRVDVGSTVSLSVFDEPAPTATPTTPTATPTATPTTTPTSPSASATDDDDDGGGNDDDGGGNGNGNGAGNGNGKGNGGSATGDGTSGDPGTDEDAALGSSTDQPAAEPTDGETGALP